MIRTAISWLKNAARKPSGTVMALLIAAALVSPVIMLMANAEHKAALSGTADAGAVYYVTPAGTGDGSSWANAMGSADFAASMDEFAPKVTVALAGTAKTGAAADTSLDVTFYLKKGQYDLTRTLPLTKGVKVYGGFDGTETAPDQRNITAIMSGDNAMSADHATILSRDASATDTFSIVTGGKNATSADTVLDGVTATGGNGTKINDYYYGGGMHNESSSPTVANCTFSGNSVNGGGGMFNNNNSSPTVTNCTFSGNAANGGGGGMYNNTSNPTVTNCTFSGNATTNGYGGAMFNISSSPTVTNCTFSGNSAQRGGAMSNVGTNGSSSPTVVNCTFSGSTATGGYGGAMFNISSAPTVSGSIFWNNLLISGDTTVSGDIYNDGAVSLDIRYSVVEAKIINSGDITVTSSDIITTDPKLQPLDRNLNALANGYASTNVYIYAIPSGSSAAKLGLPVGSTVFTSGDIKITVPSDDQTGFTRDTAVSSDAGAYALNLETIAVTVNPAAVSLAKGASANITLSANVSQGLNSLPSAATWSSSAADIAKVTGSGAAAVVTAVKKGVADITAAFTIQTGTRIVNGETKSELTGTATSVVTVDGGASSGGGSGCNAGTAASGIALLALCLPILIKRRKR